MSEFIKSAMTLGSSEATESASYFWGDLRSVVREIDGVLVVRSLTLSSEYATLRSSRFRKGIQ